MPLYNKVILGARVGKARHAISLIAQAEKIYHDDIGDGNYLTVPPGLDAFSKLSTASGIELAPLEHDEDWEYTVDGPKAAIEAEFIMLNHPCTGKLITYDLNTGKFAEDACF